MDGGSHPEERQVTVFPGNDPKSPLVVLNTYTYEGSNVNNLVRGMTDRDFTMISIHVPDWNTDMTPWPSDAPCAGDERFAGEADYYIQTLTNWTIPDVEKRLSLSPSSRIISGYSLAGLFGVYCMYRTHVFDTLVSASGSMWYPGAIEYFKDNYPIQNPRYAYLSIGTRESRTRNKMLCTNEENTVALKELLESRGAEVQFDMNPGGHLDRVNERMAKGIVWAIENSS